MKDNEITRSPDLLNPKWREKIVFGDPTIGGTANNWFTHVVVNVFPTQDAGLQFMREFAGQKPVVTRDMRQLLEWVARGKYPVGVGQSMGLMAEFRRVQAPLAYASMGEKVFWSPGSGVVYAFDRGPHPNATAVFLNWLLSKEGAEVWAPALGYASLRADVSNSHMEPALIPQDIVYEREEYVKLQQDMRAVARDVFKDLLK